MIANSIETVQVTQSIHLLFHIALLRLNTSLVAKYSPSSAYATSLSGITASISHITSIQ